MANAIEVNTPLNTFTAILTYSEFLLGFVAALFVRIFMQGYSLYLLHARGTLSMDRKSQRKRSYVKDLVALVIGIWLAISVALVEYSLGISYRTVDDQVISSSKQCVRMDASLNKSYAIDIVPPRSLRTEEWARVVSSQLGCGEAGILNVNTAVEYSPNGEVSNLSAPTCVQVGTARTAEQLRLDASVDIESVLLSSTFLSFSLEFSSFYEIYLYSIDEILSLLPGNSSVNGESSLNESSSLNSNATNTSTVRGDVSQLWSQSRESMSDLMSLNDVNPDHATLRQDSELSPCAEKNISDFVMFMRRRWAVSFIDGNENADVIHRKICLQHQGVVEYIDEPSVKGNCQNASLLNTTCLEGLARERNISTHSVNIADASALIIKHDVNNESYACTDATFRLSYLFVDGLIRSPSMQGKGLLVPLRIDVAEGRCERTLHVLGRAALLHAAVAEWEGNELSKMDRHERYQTLMMSVAPALLPKTVVSDIQGNQSGTCELREVNKVTLIPINYAFVMLMIGLGVSVLIVLGGIIARIAFYKYEWNIGSTQWSLDRIIGGQGSQRNDIRSVETEKWQLNSMTTRLRGESSRKYAIKTVHADVDKEVGAAET